MSVELGTSVVVEERKGRGGNGCNGGNLSKILSKYSEEDATKCPFAQQKIQGRSRGSVTGAPYREGNSKVATAPNTQSRR